MTLTHTTVTIAALPSHANNIFCGLAADANDTFTVGNVPVTVSALSERMARVIGLSECMIEQYAPGCYTAFVTLTHDGDPRGVRGAVHDAMQDLYGGHAKFEIVLI